MAKRCVFHDKFMTEFTSTVYQNSGASDALFLTLEQKLLAIWIRTLEPTLQILSLEDVRGRAPDTPKSRRNRPEQSLTESVQV